MQAQTTLINFTVTRDGLEDQLLAQVVAVERPDLEQLKSDLTRQQNEFKIVLKKLEDDLLARLSAAGTTIVILYTDCIVLPTFFIISSPISVTQRVISLVTQPLLRTLRQPSPLLLRLPRRLSRPRSPRCRLMRQESTIDQQPQEPHCSTSF